MTLVFDTETTGKADFKRPPEDSHQPRLVQLGAILFDEVFEPVAELSVIIKPDNYIISDEVAKIHGITQDIATKYGLSEKPVLSFFAGLCARAKVLVAHNIKFDGIVIGRAMYLHGLPHNPPETKFCTMEAMTNICKLPGNYGNFKWPTLQEAFKHCFQKEYPGAHGAITDARACAMVYQWYCQNITTK